MDAELYEGTVQPNTENILIITEMDRKKKKEPGYRVKSSITGSILIEEAATSQGKRKSLYD